MIEQILPLLPEEATRLAIWLSIAGVVAGAGLWLAGGHVSQSLVTLLLVAVGASAGLHLPRMLGWGVNAAATCVIGAVVLGVAGFVLHKFCVVIGLAALMAGWAAAAVYLGPGIADPEAVAVTRIDPAQTPTAWQQLPPPVRKNMPVAASLAAVVGLALGLVWERLAVMLMYSMAGVTLLVGMGLMWMKLSRPAWLELGPGQAWMQVVILSALVAFGTLVQWRTAAAPAEAEADADEPPADEPVNSDLDRG